MLLSLNTLRVRFPMLILMGTIGVVPLLAGEPEVVQRETWPATLLATREKLLAQPSDDLPAAAERLWQRLDVLFPVPSDWMHQDLGKRRDEWFLPEGDRQLERDWFAKLAETLPEGATALRDELAALLKQNPPRNDARWLDLTFRAGEARRKARLAQLMQVAPKIVFLKHHNLGGSHYAYTEAQSDGQAERNFHPGAALCVLELNDLYGKAKTLLEDRNGVIRDPDVSHDGRRILFSWKKSNREDDYHLYDMDVATGAIRQLTSGLGVADYEGAYLPDGSIVFNSTRCVQIVDCWWTEVSNLYTCDADGRHLRRLSFDQVHSNYPQVLDDGRVVYTRWEYNDRGQIFPQPLFQMNADGTNQTEFYGNNSFFPTSILHARGLPGSQQVVAIASGHHSSQAGKLILIDPARGRQEAAGVQLIAPDRPTKAEKIDGYGQQGELWMYPYPLSDREFLVTYLPQGRKNPSSRFDGRFGVYWMDRDGRRELLASDAELPCCQAVPLRPRTPPAARPSAVDYRKQDGVFYMHDVYQGPGLAGVPRGTIKSLRVVTMDFRAAGVGSNGNYGAMISTPPAIGNGAWDPKTVLGTTPVHDDGSAMFRVPARTPVYFQALDADGQMVQTMRSWSTLQPGERAACVGCHEDKNQSPPSYTADSLAMRGGPKQLQPFYGPTRGFSFPKEIQPILDRHCVSCHRDRSQLAWLDDPPPAPEDDKPKAFSLRADTTLDVPAKRYWSDAYLMLTGARLSDKKKRSAFIADWNKPLVNWVGAQTAPPMLPPYSFGAAKSRLVKILREGHENAKLSREELDKIACWIDLSVPYCGDYREANAWTPEETAKYERFLAKRQRLAEEESRNVEEFLKMQ